MSIIGNTNHKLQFARFQITTCNTCNISHVIIIIRHGDSVFHASHDQQSVSHTSSDVDDVTHDVVARWQNKRSCEKMRGKNVYFLPTVFL
jgi:hypothetical protein